MNMKNSTKGGPEVKDLPVLSNGIKEPRAIVLTIFDLSMSNIDRPGVIRLLIKTVSQ